MGTIFTLKKKNNPMKHHPITTRLKYQMGTSSNEKTPIIVTVFKDAFDLSVKEKKRAIEKKAQDIYDDAKNGGVIVQEKKLCIEYDRRHLVCTYLLDRKVQLALVEKFKQNGITMTCRLSYKCVELNIEV